MSPLPLAIGSGIAESQSRLSPGLFRRVPPRQICVFFMSEVRFDFLGEMDAQLQRDGRSCLNPIRTIIATRLAAAHTQRVGGPSMPDCSGNP